VRHADTGWTPLPTVLYDPSVATLELTDDELRDAAQAARLAVAQAQKDATAQPNPRISATFLECSKCYVRLAEKFEEARQNARRRT
jgi:hypothetical protein